MRKSRQKYLKTIRLVLLNSKKATSKATKEIISLQDFSCTYGSSRKIKRWTSSMYGHATIPADLFTKAHPTTTFRKYIYGIVMRHSQGKITAVYSFSLVMVFIPKGFSMIRVLTRHYVIQNR